MGSQRHAARVDGRDRVVLGAAAARGERAGAGGEGAREGVFKGWVGGQEGLWVRQRLEAGEEGGGEGQEGEGAEGEIGTM